MDISKLDSAKNESESLARLDGDLEKVIIETSKGQVSIWLNNENVSGLEKAAKKIHHKAQLYIFRYLHNLGLKEIEAPERLLPLLTEKEKASVKQAAD